VVTCRVVTLRVLQAEVT